jgi:hypothetical protein
MTEETQKPDVEVQKIEAKEVTVAQSPGSFELMVQSADQLEIFQRAGKMLAHSAWMPDTLKGDVATATIALSMGYQAGIHPVQIVQHIDVVFGRARINGKLALALLGSKMSPYSNAEHEFTGSIAKGDLTCVLTAKRKSDGKVHSVTLDLKTVKNLGWWDKDVKGKKWWQEWTEQMFCYRTSTMFINRYAPGLLFGLKTADEEVDSQ